MFLADKWASQTKDIVSLACTRWVEHHHAFESYYLLYRANVAVMDLIHYDYERDGASTTTGKEITRKKPRHHMIDSVIEDLFMKRTNVGKEFADWYEQAVKMAQSVDAQPNKLRTAKCWSRFCDNVESDGIEEYFRRSVAVPFLDTITTQLKSRLVDRNQVELFNLLPSLMLSK